MSDLVLLFSVQRWLVSLVTFVLYVNNYWRWVLGCGITWSCMLIISRRQSKSVLISISLLFFWSVWVVRGLVINSSIIIQVIPWKRMLSFQYNIDPNSCCIQMDVDPKITPFCLGIHKQANQICIKCFNQSYAILSDTLLQVNLMPKRGLINSSTISVLTIVEERNKEN